MHGFLATLASQASIIGYVVGLIGVIYTATKTTKDKREQAGREEKVRAENSVVEREHWQKNYDLQIMTMAVKEVPAMLMQQLEHRELQVKDLEAKVINVQGVADSLYVDLSVEKERYRELVRLLEDEQDRSKELKRQLDEAKGDSVPKGHRKLGHADI